MRSFVAVTIVTTASLFAEERVSYNRDVRPVLAAKCFACHGPDEDKREADLRLDVRGDHFDGKEIIRRTTTTDLDDVMPPRTSPKPLTTDEATLLKRWIAAGAEYEQHWAPSAPARHACPACTPTPRRRRPRRSARMIWI